MELGNKGQSLTLLSDAGLRVPAFLVVPRHVFITFADEAGVLSFLRNPKLFARDTFEQARQVVLKGLLPQVVRAQITEWKRSLSLFLQAGKFVVRSSANAEDAEQAAFAGLYKTYLDLTTDEEIFEAVVNCWASMFDHGVFMYVKRKGLEDLFCQSGMAVVVQVQVDSVAAGVYFSEDPSNRDVALVEGCFGFGEGVVSGKVLPYRWHVPTTGRVSGSFVGACLTEAQLQDIVCGARKVEAMMKGAIDIEWAVDKDGCINFLQARKITTVGPLEWNAPGTGSWFYDTAHYPKKMTRIFASAFGAIEKAWTASPELVGSLVGGAKLAVVNGYLFLQIRPVSKDLVGERLAVGMRYAEEKGWQYHWREWKDLIDLQNAKHLQLKRVQTETLSLLDLRSHFKRVMQNYRSSFFWHHFYNFPMFTAIGSFLVRGEEITGECPDTLLQLMQNCAGSSRGCFGTATTRALAEQLKDDPDSLEVLRQAKGAAGLRRVLYETKVGPTVKEWLNKYDHYVTSGQDCSCPTLRELPDVVISGLLQVVNGRHEPPKGLAEGILAKVENMVEREEFRTLLNDTLMLATWRDERGQENDVQAAGLLRFCLKEVGKRVSEEFDWELLLECNEEEVCAWLLQEPARPSVAELRSRRHSRLSPSNPPPFLGEPPGVPDWSLLPQAARRSEIMRDMFISRLFGPPPEKNTTGREIKGIGASYGCVTGRARILLNPEDWKEFGECDIGVVVTSDSAFNAVLPFLAGLISDFGGTLSHVAISAREFGIPCVTGTGNATQIIEEGMQVKVDGNKGLVWILE